ncbi:MAG TPA: 4Fe-4S dicluster domain-containing protein [Hyphomicrobiales bacterium]|nr:4Fe-4S dicluster domain-containing protein [Hyphomicrobiales bacterium]
MTASRRDALKLLAAAVATAAAGCSAPPEELVPYVDMPEGLVPGEPRYYATALPLGGWARGVLGKTVDGRPIKVEGNPRHPASLGATDVFMQAAIMDLYDPARSQTVENAGQVATWPAFRAALAGRLATPGTRIALLTGRLTSPTARRQIKALTARYPTLAWHVHEAAEDAAAAAGAAMAFGQPARVVPRLGDAAVVLTLDADPLGPGPMQVLHGRGFSRERTARRNDGRFVRLYAVESTPTLTGASADHRLALTPAAIGDFARLVAERLGAISPPALRGRSSRPGEATASRVNGTPSSQAEPPAPAYPPPQPSPARGQGVVAAPGPGDWERFAAAVASDLMRAKGHALVLAGPTQPPEIHALAHRMNGQLQAPVEVYADPLAGEGAADLASLVAAMRAGTVDALVILDANPVYDAPADLGFAAALRRVPLVVHAGPYRDETGAAASWHLPLSHAFESWSDLLAPDGTASIVQPLIRPLHDSRGLHEILAMLGGAEEPKGYDLVRATWQARHPGPGFEDWWRKALHDGVVADTRFPAIASDAKQSGATGAAPAGPGLLRRAAPRNDGETTLVFLPDHSAWDGRFAANPWLQECPRPMTTEVWGNALGLGPDDARRLGLDSGDVVTITVAARTLTAPVCIQEGHAPGVASLTLGYGRTQAGPIGTGLGVSAYTLRTSGAPWAPAGVTIAKAQGRAALLATQHQFKLDAETRDILPTIGLAEVVGSTVTPKGAPGPSLYPAVAYDGYAWAMVIDTTRCIGCNACIVACQSENNVPVVGPDEIAVGRDMHWLRIDAYRDATSRAPGPGFQPVPCMHCEKAPCEPVCPVEASVHDSEGLNVQVYNRCIGTRFCEANCPYKVRRFNFFGYADGQEYADLGADLVKAAHNPDVTVRARGVMEKCTYCVQRISRARRTAEKENRSIREGEVVTACQAACPTEAIVFGDRNAASDPVSRLATEPHHYALLAELDTRPRTTYLKRVRNPNPALEGEG